MRRLATYLNILKQQIAGLLITIKPYEATDVGLVTSPSQILHLCRFDEAEITAPVHVSHKNPLSKCIQFVQLWNCLEHLTSSSDIIWNVGVLAG